MLGKYPIYYRGIFLFGLHIKYNENMMDIDFNKEHWEHGKCPKYDCKKDACKCGLKKIFLASVLGDDSKDSPIAPKNGAYCNAIVVYEANSHVYIYSSEGIPTLVESGGNYEEIIELLNNKIEQEASARTAADKVLQDEIDDIKNSPDVVDIVATYADLQAYDTSHLGDKDIIRVLTDETHDGASSYYRWDKQTETWTYVGSIQMAANTIFYADLSETGNTRHIYKNSDMTGTVSVQELLDANEDGQVILRMSSAQTPENFNDAYLQNTYVGVDDYQFLFLDNRNYYEYDGTATTDTSYYYSRSTIQLELTAGNNITITGNTISATDTTYSNFTGTDGTAAGTAGLVPAPATTDAGKFLKADGTWGSAGESVTELTSADYNYPTENPNRVALWLLDPGTYKSGESSLQVGLNNNITSAWDTSTSFYIAKGSSYADIVIFSQGGVKNYVTQLPSGNPYREEASFTTLSQATGTSTTSVMSQNATTSMVFADPNTQRSVRIGNSKTTGTYSVNIGYSSGSGSGSGYVSGTYSVGVGPRASIDTHSDYSVAIGSNSQIGSYLDGAVALGAYSGSNITAAGMMDIGSSNTSYGYNSSNYRLLTGLYDGQSDHDAATYGQVISYSAINGAGAPTTATEGKYVGQLYYDTTNEAMYFLKTIDTTTTPTTYTWEALGGGSSVNVVQTTGNSTTDVMSQSATTSIVYADPSTATKVRIGSGATNAESAGIAIGTDAAINTNAWSGIAIGTRAAARSNQAIAIGQDATVQNSHSIAIGESTMASHDYSIALGRNANTTRKGELFIGCKNYNYGYNNTKNRVIGGVYDGQLSNDAATVGQVIGTTETHTVRPQDWVALSSSSPYDYQFESVFIYDIGNNTTVELINDNPVEFANHGFAIGAVSTSPKRVTFYSIGVPSANVSLKVNFKG